MGRKWCSGCRWVREGDDKKITSPWNWRRCSNWRQALEWMDTNRHSTFYPSNRCWWPQNFLYPRRILYLPTVLQEYLLRNKEEGRSWCQQWDLKMFYRETSDHQQQPPRHLNVYVKVNNLRNRRSYFFPFRCKLHFKMHYKSFLFLLLVKQTRPGTIFSCRRTKVQPLSLLQNFTKSKWERNFHPHLSYL